MVLTSTRKLPGKYEDQVFLCEFDIDNFPEVKVVDGEGQVNTVLLHLRG